jgi:hypothetical protein
LALRREKIKKNDLNMIHVENKKIVMLEVA